jgi:hypothetical protein
MAIPGMKPKLEVRAKVKTGEVRTSSKSGRTYPASTDYFICEDAEFTRLCGDKPKSILIVPAFADPAEFFSTGMEWWVKQKSGQNHLACYTKDAGSDPVALRSLPYMDADDTKRGEPVGNNRQPISCRFRECSHFQKDCKPMGRLTFYLHDEAVHATNSGPLELATKGWNSVEALSSFLSRFTTVSGRVFEVSVAFEQRGTDRFPLLSMKEANLNIDTDADIETADNIIVLAQKYERGEFRAGLADYLDATNEGWRDKPEFIARIQEVGPEAAVKTILDRELRR